MEVHRHPYKEWQASSSPDVALKKERVLPENRLRSLGDLGGRAACEADGGGAGLGDTAPQGRVQAAEAPRLQCLCGRGHIQLSCGFHPVEWPSRSHPWLGSLCARRGARYLGAPHTLSCFTGNPSWAFLG